MWSVGLAIEGQAPQPLAVASVHPLAAPAVREVSGKSILERLLDFFQAGIFM